MAAPAPPRGRGKTGVKDLNALAKLVYVLNCSPTWTTRAGGGGGGQLQRAWICFDRFNRLVPEVLSSARCGSGGLRRRRAGPAVSIEAAKSCEPDLRRLYYHEPGYLSRSELLEGRSIFRPITVAGPTSSDPRTSSAQKDAGAPQVLRLTHS